ncbi:hypothetical protein GCM10027295_14610 [Pseudaeromonas pectinilytica]
MWDLREYHGAGRGEITGTNLVRDPSRRWGHNTGNRASSLRGAPLERLSTVDQGAIRKMTGDRLTLERQKRVNPTW